MAPFIVTLPDHIQYYRDYYCNITIDVVAGQGGANFNYNALYKLLYNF